MDGLMYSEESKLSPLHKLLNELTRERLCELVLHLAKQDRHLAEEAVKQAVLLGKPVEKEPRGEGAGVAQDLSRVELRSIRRQVTAAVRSLDRMRPSQAYWHVDTVVGEVRQLLSQAKEWVEHNDGNNAFLILEALTDEYVQVWVNLDDSDGYASEFFYELDRVWLDAALVAELSAAQRQEWADKLTAWQGAVGDYGVEDVFDAAQAALLHGWDYPPLQRVLQGADVLFGSWEEPPPWHARELATARLAALERQERFEEYLNLARAAGEMESFVTMLARVGRTEEAVEIGLHELAGAQEAYALAQALLEQGGLEAALRVAEHGLTLEGDKGELATWLRDLAWDAGFVDLALRAALIGFRATPSLDAYLRIREISAERWPKIQGPLLDTLRRARSCTSAQVDVFLNEGLLDDAIAAVDKGGGYGDIERVMDAVVEHQPDWVIQTACKQADRIVEPAKAKYYHHAVNWLERARDAYLTAGRETEWKAYLRDFRERHSRKYKLMAMIKHL